MENQKKNFGKHVFLTGSIVAGTILSAAAFNPSTNPFSFRNLGTGAEIRRELGGGNTGLFGVDLKCSGKKDSTMTTKGKTKDGKCGEGKCSGKKSNKKDSSKKGKGN